ncbi:hypothetical protein DM01DRAFT_1330972 [Hesseltinella vesiculosa]|uniref:F-box domain-containing protein n=1 Tax=Hesseltinella vesiculosa TaxID=101127 RepID=A0A1X2GXM5_9FUNG|nr:hypothetical protein DM01DRAFT_1330972 [Hesseltinella vesiculosa]
MSTSNNERPPILTAPWEIMFKVTEYIGRDDLLTLRLVCKHWDAMVCSAVFKTLSLTPYYGYNVTPWPSLIECLENPLDPSRSIGAYVQHIHIQTNCVTTDELFQLAQKCLHAKTLEIPFRTLRQLNKWFLNSAETTKSKANDDLPAAPELLQLFDRLFLETSLTTLSLPNMLNGTIFKTGLLHHLAGLQRLDLGQNTHPPHLKTAFDVDLLHSLHDTCPQLKSLTCGLSSTVGDKVDLSHIKEHPPFVWDNMEQLVIHVRNYSAEDGFTGLEHTKMLAYLATIMPQLISLEYLCRGQREVRSMTAERQAAELEHQLGPLAIWDNSFPSLVELRLNGLDLNNYAAHIVFVPSVVSLRIEECACGLPQPGDSRASASWWVSQLTTMPKLVSLDLAVIMPSDWRIQSTYQAYFCVEEILNALPKLESLRLENALLHWLSPERDYLSTSALIIMLVESPETCGPPHPLISLELCSVLCLDSILFEYISARCPQLQSLHLWATPILKSSRPTALHTVLPDHANDSNSSLENCNSDGVSLYDRLTTLNDKPPTLYDRLTWLPLIHSSLSSLTLKHGVRHAAQVRAEPFRQAFTRFCVCAAPHYTGCPSHSFSGYCIYYQHIPLRFDFSDFFNSIQMWNRVRQRYLGVLCKRMKSDPIVYGQSLPF